LCAHLQAEEIFNDAMAFLDDEARKSAVPRNHQGSSFSLSGAHLSPAQTPPWAWIPGLTLATTRKTDPDTLDLHNAAAVAGGTSKSVRLPRKRAQLDAETVVRIFATRNDTSTCDMWATEQGVTTKAVRDIWNMRTWRK
jgi:hypothetical protein